MAVPVSDTVPSYRIELRSGLHDVVHGVLRITEAGALEIREATPRQPGMTRPGGGEVIRAYAPGQWMGVERREPRVRRDLQHTVRQACQCVYECCADLPAHYHNPSGEAVTYGPGSPPPEDL